VESLNAQVSTLTSDRDHQLDLLKEVEASKRSLEERVKELEELLSKSTEEDATKEEKWKSLIADLEARDEKLIRDKNELEVRFEGVQRTLVAARSERDKDHQRVEELEAKIKEHESRVSEIEVEREQLLARQAQHDDVVADLTSKWNEAVKVRNVLEEKVESLCTLYSSSSEENVKLKESLADLLASHSDLTIRFNQLQELHQSESNEMSDVVASLRNAVTARQREHELDIEIRDAKLSELNDHLGIALEEIEARDAKIEKLKEEEESLKVQIEALKGALIQAHAEMDEWRKRVEISEQTEAALKAQISDLATELESTIIQNHQNESKLKEAEQQLQSFDSIITTFKTELAAAEKAVKKANTRYDETNFELTAKIEELTDSLTEERKYRDGERDMTEIRIAQIEAEAADAIKAHEDEMRRMEVKVFEIKKELDTRASEIAELTENHRQEVGQLKYSIKEAEDLIDDYRDRLEDKDSQIDERIYAIQCLLDEKETDERRHVQAVERLKEEHETMLSATMNEVKELKALVDQLRAEREKKDNASNPYAEELQMLIQSAHESKAELQSQLETTKLKLEQVSDTNTKLSEQISDYVERINNLTRSNEDLKSQVNVGQTRIAETITKVEEKENIIASMKQTMEEAVRVQEEVKQTQMEFKRAMAEVQAQREVMERRVAFAVEEMETTKAENEK
jgi:chromosome segregation protein